MQKEEAKEKITHAIINKVLKEEKVLNSKANKVIELVKEKVVKS